MSTNKDNNNVELVSALLEIAFEAGRWMGQVDLEEHLDREQYSSIVIESIISKKTSMPAEKQSTGRTVKFNLRSQKWRNGVLLSSRAKLERCIDIFKENI